MPEDTQEERVDFEALLRERFPDMQPIHSAPSLSTFNGIGTSVFGRRNVDEETGTHVKTLCVCFLFAPIFALRAYRVADGPGERGWAFLGRHSLSGFARSWNCLVLSAVLVLSAYGAWSAEQPTRVRAAELRCASRPRSAADERRILAYT